MAAKVYTGPVLDVSFDGEVCRHAAECVRGMPEVFDVAARPWIDPAVAATDASAQQLREVVGRCPSGALQIVEH
ncbi:(4Fe-4S)-binding protein [Desertihabitans aurantiacus]|uniref:(4Fe-4S)-binding protein n=1 Tax=Desertihabitans aurantiacus TaxID=2282477 RepID=UPI000DF74306|nr:(4Fe-4S)-binding protein [Desertihabitans aurantiacus]